MNALVRTSAPPPLARLYDRLDSAKRAYKQMQVDQVATRTRVVRKFSSDAERTKRTRAGKRRVKHGQFALGEPGSSLRILQTGRLWKMAFPDLLIHERDESRWKAWARNLAAGTAFYTSALRRADPNYRTRFLRCFKPADAPDNWMDNDVLVQEVLRLKGEQLKAALLAKHPEFFSSASAQQHVIARWGYSPGLEYRERLEGNEVVVRGGGNLVLRWEDTTAAGAKVRHDLRISVPKHTAPLFKAEKRFVHFLSDGIGLRDANGRLLKGPKSATIQRGVLPRAGFPLIEDGEVITRLWQAERAAIAD